ncbi:MAG: hypothetical protein KY453_01475 [Gemmatimonadetes bacterium]|nr:hypothetical protein [Gemmatimonadota bacterium]
MTVSVSPCGGRFIPLLLLLLAACSSPPPPEWHEEDGYRWRELRVSGGRAPGFVAVDADADVAGTSAEPVGGATLEAGRRG